MRAIRATRFGTPDVLELVAAAAAHADIEARRFVGKSLLIV